MPKYRGHQGCAFVCHTLFETLDIVIEFDYEITCDAIPQSWDEPASGMEYEVTYTGIYEDKPGMSKHAPKDYLEVPLWLEKVLQEYLEESDSVYDAIARDLED